MRADRGINFPDSELGLPALSTTDPADRNFVSRNADMVRFSFVQMLDDLQRLMDGLAVRNAAELPIVATIETSRAVRNLPQMILGSIGRHRVGVMIARRDLAKNWAACGWPKFRKRFYGWASRRTFQSSGPPAVVESIKKKGVRFRSDFTDAAMGVRAECVILNKGPFVSQAVQALHNVLAPMQDHQHKKFSRLRASHW